MGSEMCIRDSDGTVCHIVMSTPTEVQCKVEEFVTEVLRRELQTFNMIIDVNGQQVEVAVVLQAARLRLTSITPESVSPIIPQLLTLQLNDAYDSTNMELDTFTVGLAATDTDNARPNGDLVRWLNVVDFDKTAKTITVKYGGAYTGKYKILLESQLQGAFRTGGRYEVKFEYTDFNPKAGSKYGGQLLTIDGSHFSNDPLKNPIKIGYEYIRGVVHYCDVLESADTQIKCRMRLDYEREAGDQELIVFASTFEEARCKASTCDLTFLDTDMLPTVETKTVAYDGISGKHQVEVFGYDITDVSPDTIQVYIGGVEQTVLQVTTSSVLIQVDDIKSGLESQTFEIYFEVGAGNGFAELYQEGIVMTPEFKGLQTSTVSDSGSKIYAEVSGLGVDDTDVTLADVGGASICDSAKMVSYGMLECMTKAQTLSSTTVKLMVDNVAYTCNGELSCTIETFPSGQPAYSSPILASGTTIKLTGSNLLTIAGAFDCMCSYGGIDADSCSVDGNGDALCVFDLGVPSLSGPAAPVLMINTDNAGIMACHTVTGTDQLDNTFVAPGGLVDVDCSFAGGCIIEIPAVGLSSNVLGGIQKITACGNDATMIPSMSDDTTAFFYAPELKTAASEDNAKRSSAEMITPRNEFGSDAAFEGKLFDGVNVPGLTSTGSNCFVGVTYDGGKTAILEEVRFFMDYFGNNFDRYDGNLKFQGSDDAFATDINDIFTVGAEIHEGWNSYDVSKPKYTSYRIFNAENNGCNGLGELKLYGKEVYDNPSSMVSCDVELFDVEASTYTPIGQSIDYDLQLTPYLDAIIPRYGSVEGGTEISITGTEFNTNNVNDVTVLIDGIDCGVTFVNPLLIQCTTGSRPGLYLTEPTLEVYIAGKGLADCGQHKFRYMSLWSETSTWGGQFAPVDGESVVVPAGLNLLVDIDTSPMLNMVLVDGGAIVFPSDADPDHQRNFDAKIIFVNNGVFEAGTEDDPYTSKLTITMHGKKYDPTVPIYGNKVLGVRNSVLDLHGIQRDSWTMLETTAAVGATEITV